MENFKGTFETRKRSFISAFSICMTVPLSVIRNYNNEQTSTQFFLIRNSVATLVATFSSNFIKTNRLNNGSFSEQAPPQILVCISARVSDPASCLRLYAVTQVSFYS